MRPPALTTAINKAMSSNLLEARKDVSSNVSPDVHQVPEEVQRAASSASSEMSDLRIAGSPAKIPTDPDSLRPEIAKLTVHRVENS